MTDRDLGALLERASEHLPEVDFAEGAWAAALSERARRRRVVVGTLGAVAAAGLAVTAVQLGGSTIPRPTPATSSSPSPGNVGTLSDGTAYAVMPLEGTEAQLPYFDAGLPSVIDVRGKVARSFAGPPASVVAVYLRAEGEIFHPVLVSGDGAQVVLDQVDLVTTNDANGNAATPLGPRAFGGGGRYVVFPQRDHVIRLDTRTGTTTSYAVPSEHLEWADWEGSGSVVVARDAEHAWTIDTAQPEAKAVAAGAMYPGPFRITSPGSTSVPAPAAGTHPALQLPVVTSADQPRSDTMSARMVTSPANEVWGETLSNSGWAAAGAFFDQTVTSAVIRRGNGPIYQGLVAVDTQSWRARVLLAPENPDGQTGRFKGCCTVLGWADGTTVLYQSVGSHGRWILAWNVDTGAVYDVSRLTTGAPDDPPSPIALNVGTRG